jgi:hypothetical protein
LNFFSFYSLVYTFIIILTSNFFIFSITVIWFDKNQELILYVSRDFISHHSFDEFLEYNYFYFCLLLLFSYWSLVFLNAKKLYFQSDYFYLILNTKILVKIIEQLKYSKQDAQYNSDISYFKSELKTFKYLDME